MLLLPLAALVAFSEFLSFNRIFQVDELQEVFTARLLATGDAARYDASANLMLLGPMTWIAAHIDRAALLLRCERMLFFAIFWINLCLIVRCAGFRLRSRSGLVALLLTATLAPLWDYGFEVRHETPLLTAILLAWSFARPLAIDARRRLAIVGFLAVIAQFIAFKAFAYTLPIVLFAIVAAVWDDKRSIVRSVAELVAGAVAGFAAGAAVHLMAGTWTFFSSDTKAMSHTVTNAARFSSGAMFERAMIEAPILWVLVICAIVAALRRFNFRNMVSRESLLPELAFFAGAIVAALANPTPFPYNIVLFVPQAAILVMRLWPAPWIREQRWRLIAPALILLHVVIWGRVTVRHIWMSNARQTRLMETAEDLTDPKEHAVLDGAGLVPTRHPPNRHWLIHTFTIEAFRSGAFPQIRAQLAEGKTPVVIPNYRLTWLPRADKTFINTHYFGLAGDFLVAGTALHEGENAWECIVPGRYFVAAKPITIDGSPVDSANVTLPRGMHTIVAPRPSALIWLGPDLEVPPLLRPGGAERVFINWY